MAKPVFHVNSPLVIRRFQIEDLIEQDATGVIFRALDTHTGNIVAVRRFFPFGANGGGLHAEEQIAYNIAVERLSEVKHPSLRAIICGGCDPIDGIPYIATEWIEGEPIQMFLDQGPLPADVASELITEALEVCELLSQILAEEGVWVETGPQSIIAGNEQSGRGFTFWISPLKWLGGSDQARGLDAIITLTEEVMGWKGRRVNDQAGHGLGAWLKWLRRTANTTSLHEARETLAASVGVEPPPPAKNHNLSSARQTSTTVKPATSKIWWALNISLVLVTGGLAAWLLVRLRERVATNQPASISAPAEPAIAAPHHEQVIQWDNYALLILKDGKQVSVEGVLADIKFSEKRITMYLLFAKTPGKNDCRGAVATKTAPTNLSPAALTPLIGQKVRLRGKLIILKSFGLQRPEIVINDRTSIEVVK